MDISKKYFSINNLALFFIIILAFFLRVYKINHHLDGGISFEETAYLKTILTGNFSEFRFKYPPFFDLWLHSINKIYFLFNFLAGHFKNFSELVNAFNIDYSPDFVRLVFVHRMVIAVIGTLTVSVVFFITKCLFNGGAGLIAALFLAVTPLHICTSMSAVSPDNLQLFFICLAFLYICKIFQQPPQSKYYILTGVFIGLATASKYFGIFCLGPLFLAHYFARKDSRQDKYIYFSIVVILGVLFITCFPAMVMNIKGLINTIGIFIHGRGLPISSDLAAYRPLSQIKGWVSYPHSLIHGLGLGVFVLSISGLLFSLVKHSKKEMLILVFPLSFYFFIGLFYHPLIRYILPLVPFMILLSVNLLIFISGKIYLSNKRKLILCLIICGLVFPSLKESIYYKHWFSQRSIEENIKNWIMNNIPIGSYVLFDGTNLSSIGKLEPLLFYNQQIPYRVTVIDWQHDFNPEHFFSDNKFDYVIIDTTRFVPERLKPIYKYIDKKFTMIKEFNPLFPTPRHNYFSIYGTFLNHSYKIYENNKIGC